MKQSQICPKCGSKEIVNIVQKHSGTNVGGANIIWTGIFLKAAQIHRYICCDCGYTEEYVDKSDIKNIREYYNK